MRPLMHSAFGANHVLPAKLGKEAMVLARDQLGAVLERYPECGLDARPLVEHACDHEASVGTLADGPVDRVAYLEVAQQLVPSISREDRGIAALAIGARMTASAVGIDRPAEGHARLLWHPVQDRAGAHLIKTRLERLGRVKAPYHGLVAIAGQAPLLLPVDREIIPTHEHMFAYASS